MKNKITTNISLKIVSLFFAFLLWLVVNNINDPTIDRSFINIPVTLLNTELITDSGQVYEVLDETDIIDRVTVSAPRSVISNLNTGNIVATADVSELSSLDTISIRLSTNLSNSDIENITASNDTVRLNIEEKKTRSLALRTTTSGVVEEGYLLGDITPDQNLVRISGPESSINKVAKAVADVPVTGFTSDISDNAEIKLYDSNDNLIRDSRITQNTKSVGVKVSIYKTQEVPVVLTISGTPANGFRVSGEVQGSRSSVLLAGKENVLRNINSIEVSGDVLDISGLREDYVTQINIRDYLPDNVFLADSSQNEIDVTVTILPLATRRLEVQGDRVQITNVPEGYRATLSELEENIVLEVRGFWEDVSGLRGSNLQASVDVAAFMQKQNMTEPVEGFYSVEVDFGLPENVSLDNPVTVIMHLSKMEEE